VVLKVAHKIALGFTVILLLLLIASISSIRLLNKIESATRKVNEQALPIQNLSNQIQTQLLKQAKISSLISSITNSSSLTKLEEEFISEKSALTRSKNEITRLLAKQQINKHIGNFLQHYNNYQQTVDQMFAAKAAILEKTNNLNAQQQILNEYLNETGALIVDLSY